MTNHGSPDVSVVDEFFGEDARREYAHLAGELTGGGITLAKCGLSRGRPRCDSRCARAVRRPYDTVFNLGGIGHT